MGAYEQVTGTAVLVAANTSGSATAVCPVGHKVIGGGASITGYDAAQDIVFISTSRPVSDRIWRIEISTSMATSNPVTLTAHAVCLGM